MKVGDKVIVTKRNWHTNPKRKGTLVGILQQYHKHTFQVMDVYRVYFYDEEGKYKDGCDISKNYGDTIEIDIQETREAKLKELGI